MSADFTGRLGRLELCIYRSSTNVLTDAWYSSDVNDHIILTIFVRHVVVKMMMFYS